MLADRVHVALLVERLGRDLEAAVAPHHVLEDPARALVPVERAPDRLDRAGGDLVALDHQLGELTDHRLPHRHVLLGPVEGQYVAAQVDLALEVLLQRPHDQIVGAGQLGGDIVGELELLARHDY